MTTRWYHPICGAYRRPETFLEALATTPAAFDGRETLAHEAQLSVTHRRAPRVYSAGLATTGRGGR